MNDSRVGAAGVQAFVQLVLLRLAGLLSLAAVAPAALVAWSLLLVAVWGRISPLLAIARFPYLRPSGGSAAFHGEGRRSLVRELLPALLLLVLLLGLAPLLVVLLPALPALGLPFWIGRRLGGHTGDTYGWCVEWSEALGLLLCGVVVSALGSPAG
jgi:adenosylcobinamide-GDP ribazoletransferase